MKLFIRTNPMFSAALALACMFPAAIAAAAEPQIIYVAPNGTDSGKGTLKSPLQTLAKARDAVRAIPATFEGDIVVRIKAGTYELPETLTFGPQDGGRGGHKVIYEAETGAKVLISGGSPVTGWQKAENGMWKAPLKRNVKLRTLYVDDRPAAMASVEAWGTPAGDYKITAGQAPWAWATGTKVDGVRYDRGIPLIARNADDVEITSFQTWNTAIVCVREAVASNGAVILKLQQPYGAIAQTCYWACFVPGTKHRVSNAFEFLKQPGQFYFDRSAQTVYYIPREGEDMTTACVVAPRLVRLLHIAGTDPSQRVRNLEFRGLNFAHTDWNLADVEGSHGKTCVQGATVTNAFSLAKNWHEDIYRNTDVVPGAIELEHCEDIRFERNRMEHLAVEGIALPNDAQRVSIIGNVIQDTGGGAVLIGHPQHAFEGDGPEIVHTTNGVPDAAGPDKEKYPKNRERVCHDNLIQNNLIHDIGRDFPAHAAITVFFAEGVRIEHNDIAQTPFNGVSLGWGWWNLNGDGESVVPGHPSPTARNNHVCFNRFFRVMQVLHDSGAIYTLGAQPGTLIEGNYIEGVGDNAESSREYRYARHSDEGSAFILNKDMVMDIGSTIWAIHGFAWGKQHDNTCENIYTNSIRCSIRDKVANLYYNADNVWPATAFAIVQRSGLEPAFDDLKTSNAGPALADRILPVSTIVAPGESLPVPPLTGAKGWIGWAQEGAKTLGMKTPGSATAITAPSKDGRFHLLVDDGAGNVTQSKAKIVVRSVPPAVKGLANGATYSAAPRPTWEGLAYLDNDTLPLDPGTPLVRNGAHTLTVRLANGMETKISFTLNLPQTWMEAEQATLKGGAVIASEPSASGGKMVIFKPKNQDETEGILTFSNLPSGHLLRLVTWANEKQELMVTLNGEASREVPLTETLKPGAGQIVRFHVTEIPMDIPQGSSVAIGFNKTSSSCGLDAIAVTSEFPPASAPKARP